MQSMRLTPLLHDMLQREWAERITTGSSAR
jgi:hypothetical protein